LRRLLGRKAVTIIVAIISLSTIPAAGVAATATPALAANITGPICNSFGHMYCIGAPNLSNGSPVVLTSSGRTITEIDQNFKTGNGFEVYRLQITATANTTSQCLDIAASGNITLRDCSGGNSNNTNWAKEFATGGIIWISNTTNLNLTSDNALNDQLFKMEMAAAAVTSGGTTSRLGRTDPFQPDRQESAAPVVADGAAAVAEDRLDERVGEDRAQAAGRISGTHEIDVAWLKSRAAHGQGRAAGQPPA
jgi:hypothetical protein